MLLTESDLRALWQNGRNPLPAFPPGTRFSPAAQDFLKDHGLEVRFETSPASDAERTLPYPAVLSGSHTPPYSAASTPSTYKLTYLDTRLSAWQALAALAAAQARHFRLSALAARLDDLASAGAAPFSAVGGSAETERPAVTDHVMIYWLRYLRAEAHALAVLARETNAVAPETVRGLETLEVKVQTLEASFLSGALGWGAGA